MKITTFKQNADDKSYRIGILDGDVITDATSLASDGGLSTSEIVECFDLDGEFAAKLKSADLAALPKIDRRAVKICAPIPRPGKIICIGLNYRDHAEESGMAIPKSPIIFSKFGTCVVGPGDTILVPRGSEQTDYEAEFAFIIGRRGKHVALENAMDHVWGYVNFNDVSARDFQFADGQWVRGKSCDTFAPMGEFAVSRDEIADPHDLRIRLRLNGATMQDSTTAQLIFKIPELIEFLSRSMPLEPGDVIATGTPPGVGFARKPPVFLKDGDVCEVEIEGLGVLRNKVAAD